MLNRILICETQRRLFYGWLPPRSVNLIIAHPLLHSSQSHVFRTLVHCFHLTHHHCSWLGDGWRLSTILYSWLEWVLETDHTHAQHETHSQEHRGQTNHVTKSLVLLHAELLMMTMLDGWSD